MRPLRTNCDRGNAVVEFIAFGVVLFAPMAAFATSMTTDALQKQIVSSAAPQLARAASSGAFAFDELSRRYLASFSGLQISSTRSDFLVTVSVRLGSTQAVAKQVL